MTAPIDQWRKRRGMIVSPEGREFDTRFFDGKQELVDYLNAYLPARIARYDFEPEQPREHHEAYDKATD